MDMETYLAERLHELEQQRIETIQSLEIVQDKLKKADAKQATQPDVEHHKKWVEIIKGLEAQLLAGRSRLSSIDVETRDKSQKLLELREKTRQEREHKQAIIKKLQNMSPEEAANLTLEELAVLQEYELSQGAIGEIELEVPAPPSEPAEAAPADAPEAAATQQAAPAFDQQQLSAALQKALTGQVGALTLNEMGMLIVFYDTLRGRAQENETARQHAKALQTALAAACSTCQRLQLAWTNHGAGVC